MNPWLPILSVIILGLITAGLLLLAMLREQSARLKAIEAYVNSCIPEESGSKKKRVD